VPTEDVAGWVVGIGARMSPSSTFGVLELLHEAAFRGRESRQGWLGTDQSQVYLDADSFKVTTLVRLVAPPARTAVLVWGRDYGSQD
jgi:hypothetical protein